MNRQRRPNNLLKPTDHWWHKLKLSTQKFAVLLTIGAVISGFSYVFLTNHTSAQGFAIRDLQRSITKLETENQRLELQAADLRSLSSIQATSTQLGLVPADNFQYIIPSSGAVAVR